jgi:predicted nicotinamide N-methyase
MPGGLPPGIGVSADLARWSSLGGPMARRSTAQRAARPLTLAQRRVFVARHTRLQPVPDVPSIRLHLADDAAPVWRATETATGDAAAPIPFWAFAWAGGIALARFVLEHPDVVAGRRLLDFATGSGICAIAALQAGASEVTGVDIDPFAEAALGLNARANGVKVGFIGRDLLDDEPPEVDLILAGDTWYEGPFAARVAPWLLRAAASGTGVLVADPGRRYFPPSGFERLASYEVRTTTKLEDRDVVVARVYRLGGSSPDSPERSDT